MRPLALFFLTEQSPLQNRGFKNDHSPTCKGQLEVFYRLSRFVKVPTKEKGGTITTVAHLWCGKGAVADFCTQGTVFGVFPLFFFHSSVQRNVWKS